MLISHYTGRYIFAAPHMYSAAMQSCNVGLCLPVCLSALCTSAVMFVLYRNEKTYPLSLLPSGSSTVRGFQYQTLWQLLGTPNGGVEYDTYDTIVGI